MSRQLVRYTAIRMNDGTKLLKCIFKIKTRDVFVLYPDGTSIYFGLRKYMDEEKLQRMGYFKKSSDALAYRARKVKSNIRRLQKIRAQANTEWSEIRKLIAQHGG